ncbi:hypothetical protein [Cyanobium gracile]|uniref:Uncharacterized protein n=1 Tax=Cyanobium gracile (strain ATCC 27147 / PCC 6307) TaxID=292564 RepID=K9P3X2_CYAGP|nr:hypothetical protein [Cyanobium gracile]AFY27688.1 hypothetical protein Cyagr_0496 [Cyanobium gracile PCC 6307]
MSDPSDSIDLPGQLQALTRRLGQSNPELYRHVALYLQVLRQVLPQQVRQACFHLATQVHPRRYSELPVERRQLLHRQIQELVGRCCSLLTVEQLVILAAQISRERQRRDRHERELLLEELTWEGDSGGGEPEPLPPGSVQIAFAPPLAGGSFLWGALGRGEAPPPDSDQGQKEDPHDGQPQHRDAAQTDDPDDDAEEDSGEDPSDEAKVGSGPELADTLWQAGRLPDDPERVLRWMDGMELALGRRLRNLSHAVNVELLRGGVSRSLLPVSLLDAVLAGQLETMAAPANLMRLPLPFPGARASQAQTLAVLLRPTDLELEEPRLRTCRRRLQQHRQEVRRMAQQFRRLQRRLRIHQAEQLWLQDIRPPSIPND